MAAISRKGLSVIELIVAVAIIATLVGLLLPAIQKIRSAAIRTKSMNNLRQIDVAMHSFAASSEGALPGIDTAVLLQLLPYLDGGEAAMNRWRSNLGGNIDMAVFLDPADPTLLSPQYQPDYGLPIGNRSSYVANAVALAGRPILPSSFPDGVSNTIAFT